MATSPPEYLAARQAVEALRNGVPNRAAVRELGCSQSRIEQRFVRMLEEAEDHGHVQEVGPARRGLLVSAEFGNGKSHLLEHLEHLALSRNFVCSRVTISKETPLYDLGKVFSAAMDNGRTPDRGGRFVEDLSFRIREHPEKLEAFAEWARKAAAGDLISPMFPASLRVYERSDDYELLDAIESFWAGDKIQLPKLREGLREIGEAQNHRFRAPKAADLPAQRLRFALELIKAMGYRGWVVLLDEIELIGEYPILQRGRSYAEVAHWLGHTKRRDDPGLISVGTVTEDFALAVIDPSYEKGKKDRANVRPRLEQSARYAALGGPAETGMNLLEHHCVALDPPEENDIYSTMDKLRNLYRRAYDWNPPVHHTTAGGAGLQGRMRYKVRAAINEWDLRRLRPDYRPDTIIDPFDQNYVEKPELEHHGTTDPA